MKFAISILIAARAFACIAIDRDRILAGDFAPFAAPDPKLEIAATPIPGVTRTFSVAEIERIARLHNIAVAGPTAETCFERATEPLTAAQLFPILRNALALPDAQIEILDFSHSGVPHGTLAFSKSGLTAAGIWRGRIIYDQSRSSPVWVKVRVTVERTWVEAAAEIESGKLIDAARLRLRTGPRFPFAPLPLNALDLAVNQKTLRAIHAGEPIFAAMLARPREVEIGDAVHVNVSSGAARLEFDAVAQSSAHAGENVLVRNPENNRVFQARVDGKGKVSVVK